MERRRLNHRHWWLICVVLAGLGLAQSAYLMGRLFASFNPDRSGFIDLCSVLFSADCDHAQADERFWILGVPMAGWGLVYFSTLGALLVLARYVRQAFASEALLAGSLVTLAGVGAGLTLTVAALLGGVPLCPFCLSVHATSLLLLLALRKASPEPVAEQVRLLRAAWTWLVRSGIEASERARWSVVGFGGVALVAVTAYQWVFIETALRRPREGPPPDRAAVITSYQASPRVALSVTEDDPHVGALAATVQLVVFESFRCRGCRRLAATLSRLQHRFRDRLVVVYKHYPLSTRCNERLARDIQPGSCEIAWAAEAAHRQARFWPFHDAMLAAGAAFSPEAVVELARRLGLDPVRFDADRRSASTRDRVAADIALGNRLKIPGTPAVFLDGRLVPAPRADVLEILVRHAIDGASQNRGRAMAPTMGTVRPRHDGRPSEGG